MKNLNCFIYKNEIFEAFIIVYDDKLMITEVSLVIKKRFKKYKKFIIHRLLWTTTVLSHNSKQLLLDHCFKLILNMLFVFLWVVQVLRNLHI